MFWLCCIPGVLEDINDLNKLDHVNKSILDYLLEPNVSTGQSNALKDLYWAQKIAQTDQAQAWLDYANISLNPDSPQCRDLYNSLTFRFYRSEEGAPNAVTMMETRLYSSYVPSQEYFEDCVYAIILAIALRPQFCSLQARPPIDRAQPSQYYYKYNTPHPWITQSSTQSLDYRSYPFYELEIDGKDQVVAVSDHGLDFYNCYFYDSENGGVPTNGVSFLKFNFKY